MEEQEQIIFFQYANVGYFSEEKVEYTQLQNNHIDRGDKTDCWSLGLGIGM